MLLPVLLLLLFFGGGKEGVKVYIEKLAAELKDTMAMCGAFTLKEIPLRWCAAVKCL